MENVVTFYVSLVQFLTLWYSIWPFGIVCVHTFPDLVCLDQEKSGNPGVRPVPQSISKYELFRAGL
jgi:hypothetical protein